MHFIQCDMLCYGALNSHIDQGRSAVIVSLHLMFWCTWIDFRNYLLFFSNSKALELIHLISYNSVCTNSYLHPAAFSSAMSAFVWGHCTGCRKRLAGNFINLAGILPTAKNRSDTVQYENQPYNMTINYKKKELYNFIIL